MDGVTLGTAQVRPGWGCAPSLSWIEERAGRRQEAEGRAGLTQHGAVRAEALVRRRPRPKAFGCLLRTWRPAGGLWQLLAAESLNSFAFGSHKLFNFCLQTIEPLSRRSTEGFEKLNVLQVQLRAKCTEDQHGLFLRQLIIHPCGSRMMDRQKNVRSVCLRR